MGNSQPFLQTYSDTRGNSTGNLDTDLHSKIVLLALTFQRLRIIWSSSPYATADIFADLKLNRDEPDPAQAASIGTDNVSNGKDEAEATVNQTPQEMLRSLPGIVSAFRRRLDVRLIGRRRTPKTTSLSWRSSGTWKIWSRWI